MKKKLILVVDDDKNTRRLIKDILMKTNLYEVIQATNGEACLKKLDDFHPDLVLLDLQMPGIDGIETLKQIGKKYKNKYWRYYGNKKATDRKIR